LEICRNENAKSGRLPVPEFDGPVHWHVKLIFILPKNERGNIRIRDFSQFRTRLSAFNEVEVIDPDAVPTLSALQFR